jgi:hypothetical protein
VKIEILYLSGCPHHPSAVDRLKEALRQEEESAELVEIQIQDAVMAQSVGFLGSPTIRINGQDVEPAARSMQRFGLTCRIYFENGRREGVPPLEWIRMAVREVRRKVSDAGSK